MRTGKIYVEGDDVYVEFDEEFLERKDLTPEEMYWKITHAMEPLGFEFDGPFSISKTAYYDSCEPNKRYHLVVKKKAI